MIIGTLNINSIASKIEQLREIIGNSLDILVVQEPKLDSSFPTEQIGNSGLNSMMLSLSNQQSGEATPIVLKDRLLTDSVVFSEDFPSINCSNNGITTNSNVVSHASQNNCVNFTSCTYTAK